MESFAGAVPLWALQTKKWLWKEDTLQGQIQRSAVHKKCELLHHDTFGWSHENGGDLAALAVIFPVISMWMFDDSARNFQRFSASIWSVSDSIMLMAGHFLKCLTIRMPPETKKRNRCLFWYIAARCPKVCWFKEFKGCDISSGLKLSFGGWNSVTFVTIRSSKKKKFYMFWFSLKTRGTRFSWKTYMGENRFQPVLIILLFPACEVRIC